MNIGDTFTVSGFHIQVRNTERRWWQFWKPRMVDGPLQKFHVVAALQSEKTHGRINTP